MEISENRDEMSINDMIEYLGHYYYTVGFSDFINGTKE